MVYFAFCKEIERWHTGTPAHILLYISVFVIRFENNSVFQNTEKVVREKVNILYALLPSTNGKRFTKIYVIRVSIDFVVMVDFFFAKSKCNKVFQQFNFHSIQYTWPWMKSFCSRSRTKAI